MLEALWPLGRAAKLLRMIDMVITHGNVADATRAEASCKELRLAFGQVELILQGMRGNAGPWFL